MSKVAILADVHGNLPALEAVLRDARMAGVSELFFLGDAVGYGPQPVECLELLARECPKENMLLGNHDWVCLKEGRADWYPLFAGQVLKWTRNILLQVVVRTPTGNQPGMEWLGSLQERLVSPMGLMVHGSPRDPVHEYVCPGEVADARKLEAIFSLVSHQCFIGNTHIPGVIVENLGRWIAPEDVASRYLVTDRRALINVGSVGQPRDEDPRACYVLYDGVAVEWRRVEYDIEGVVKRMSSIPEINPHLGQRLFEGK